MAFRLIRKQEITLNALRNCTGTVLPPALASLRRRLPQSTYSAIPTEYSGLPTRNDQGFAPGEFGKNFSIHAFASSLAPHCARGPADLRPADGPPFGSYRCPQETIRS